jgi:hypothetical protein
MTALEELTSWIENELVIVVESADAYEDGQYRGLGLEGSVKLKELHRLVRKALVEQLETELESLKESYAS